MIERTLYQVRVLTRGGKLLFCGEFGCPVNSERIIEACCISMNDSPGPEIKLWLAQAIEIVRNWNQDSQVAVAGVHVGTVEVTESGKVWVLT